MIKPTFLNSNTINKNTPTKQQKIFYASMGTTGAIGGYLLPVYKTLDSIPYVKDAFDPKYKHLNQDGNLIMPAKKVLIRIKTKTPNYPLKILLAIVGAALGVFAAHKITNKKTHPNEKY